jgi:LemA protein
VGRLTPEGVMGVFALLLAGAVLVAYAIVIYNGLVALRNETRRAWANVDVLLKQRHDEVPNLVATVQGYAAHERGLFESVAAARARALQAPDRAARVEAEADLDAGVARLVALAESYPQLKADQPFLRLQARLTELEDEIADRRELYNDAVTALHNRIRTFPDALVAALTGQQRREALFSAAPDERQPVAAHFA